MAASHSVGKLAKDVIFGASAACKEAIKKYGSDKVTNATIGSIMNDDGTIACIPVVEHLLRNLPIGDLISYAPISGVPAYLDAVTDVVFGQYRPEGYTAAVATAGGTGALHHTIWNYTEQGDSVLTANWYWGPYNMLCREVGRQLETFELFDAQKQFNLADFSNKFTQILSKQDSILVILNTPAHNPTGYSLSDADWQGVLDICKEAAKKTQKKITLLVDVAYIDFAGEATETRRFMKNFSNLPDNILTVFAFSMSKGYTVYGQRCGAMVGLSASSAVIQEFADINKYTSRATWSNINHGAMEVLIAIHRDQKLAKQFRQEQDTLYQMIKKRGAIFMEEAKACDLNALPYKAGFFLSIPSTNSAAVCDALHEDLIYAVPLKAGVRIAACAVSATKMHGIAAKIKKALEKVE